MLLSFLASLFVIWKNKLKGKKSNKMIFFNETEEEEENKWDEHESSRIEL